MDFLDAKFSRQLTNWMKINHLVPIDAREYSRYLKVKDLFKESGNLSRKGEVVETPWGLVEV